MQMQQLITNVIFLIADTRLCDIQRHQGRMDGAGKKVKVSLQKFMCLRRGGGFFNQTVVFAVVASPPLPQYRNQCGNNRPRDSEQRHAARPYRIIFLSVPPSSKIRELPNELLSLENQLPSPFFYCDRPRVSFN